MELNTQQKELRNKILAIIDRDTKLMGIDTSMYRDRKVMMADDILSELKERDEKLIGEAIDFGAKKVRDLYEDSGKYLLGGTSIEKSKAYYIQSIT